MIGRRILAGLMALTGAFLVACVPGQSNATPTGATPGGGAATVTRSVELTEVAGVRAASGSPASGTAAAGSPASPFIITQPTGTPSGTIAASPATAAAGAASAPTPAAPTAPPVVPPTAAPAARPTQIVKVQAEDGANIRATPDTNAAIILKADYGAEFPFTELDVPGADGTSRWVHVTLPDKAGYIRKDLLSEPRPPSPPTPTPDPRTPTAPPAAAPTNTPKP